MTGHCLAYADNIADEVARVLPTADLAGREACVCLEGPPGAVRAGSRLRGMLGRVRALRCDAPSVVDWVRAESFLNPYFHTVTVRELSPAAAAAATAAAAARTAAAAVPEWPCTSCGVPEWPLLAHDSGLCRWCPPECSANSTANDESRSAVSDQLADSEAAPACSTATVHAAAKRQAARRIIAAIASRHRVLREAHHAADVCAAPSGVSICCPSQLQTRIQQQQSCSPSPLPSREPVDTATASATDQPSSSRTGTSTSSTARTSTGTPAQVTPSAPPTPRPFAATNGTRSAAASRSVSDIAAGADIPDAARFTGSDMVAVVAAVVLLVAGLSRCWMA